MFILVVNGAESFEDCLLGKYLCLNKGRSHFSTAVLVVVGQYWIGFEMRRTIHHSNRSFHRSRDRAGGGKATVAEVTCILLYTTVQWPKFQLPVGSLWQFEAHSVGRRKLKFQK